MAALNDAALIALFEYSNAHPLHALRLAEAQRVTALAAASPGAKTHIAFASSFYLNPRETRAIAEAS